MISFALILLSQLLVAYLGYKSRSIRVYHRSPTPGFAAVILGFIALLGFVLILIIG